MDNPRPQLDSQTLHQVRWLLGGLLTLLAAWTVFYMDVDASVLLILTTLIVPLVTWRPVLAAKVPGWAHLLAFPLIVAVFAADFYQTREPLPVMIRLGLMLLFYRGVTLRTRREDMQLILLCLFLVVVAGVLTVSLVFVLQILMFTGCALALLLAITLSNAASDEQPTGAAGSGPPAWVKVEWGATLRRLRAVLDWRVLALGSVLFAGVVGLSALLFLMIPRFELGTNFFLDQLMSGRSRSGFSETVNFGDVVDIQQDRSLALSVDVTDPGLVPATPYWRMLALDHYARGGFMMSPGLQAELQRSETELARHRGTASAGTDAPVWTLYLEPGVSRYLPLVGPYHQIAFSNPQALLVNPGQTVVALPRDPPKMIAYRVEGMLPTARFEDPTMAARLAKWNATDPALRREYSPDNYDYMEGPPLPPVYLGLGLPPDELAKLRAWVDEIGPPVDGDHEGFVRRACAWLERRHGYSLSMSLPPGEGDVLVRWMDSPEPGHCELFAGSLVLLCRAAGVPARVVVGFKGGVWNQTSGSITVTNADAHAWCEIFDGRRHWVRADPTPGAGGLSRPEAAAAAAVADGATRLQNDSGWAARWNSLRVFWYRRIVNFDQQSQMDMVRSAGRMAESYAKRLLTELDRRLKSAAEWLSTPWSLGRVGWLGGGLLGLAALIWLWRKIDVASWWRSLRGADPVRREAGRWLRRLELKGVPEDHAVRDDLLRLRYGRRNTWAPSASVFKAARAAIREWTRRRRGR